MVTQNASAEVEAFNAKPVPGGYERVTIRRTRGKALRFHGRLLGEEVVGHRDRDRWLELRLWETPAGAWIVERVSASDEPGERDFANALVLKGDTADRPYLAMEWLDWINPAKSLARRMKWRFEEFVD